MDVQYSHNYSTFPDIFEHLKVVSSFSLPPLEGRVNIEEYANKLFIHAEREEAYYNGELTGLIAYYYTEGEKEAFISNVSVLPEFKNKGIASSLLSKVMLFLQDKGVCKISMEVANNRAIIDFYRKNGFDLDREIDHTKFMMVSYLHDQIPLVSILCLVYNHKDFIRKCLDGFVMQQTNFPIEILIHDDASTDGSAEIIREYKEKYPLLFKPIYQTINQYSKGIPVSHTYQYPRCSGKYIATCEGDDYWTDPFKLQKQVDFLEKNLDYYVVGMRSFVYTENSGIYSFYDNSLHIKTSFLVSDYIKNILMHTSTFCIRRESIITSTYPKEIMQGDVYLILHSSSEGTKKIKVLKDFGSVYRIHGGGITKSANHMNTKKTYDSMCKILDSYNIYSKGKDQKAVIYKKKRDRILMEIRNSTKKEKVVIVMRNFFFFLHVIIEFLIKKYRILFIKNYLRINNFKLNLNKYMK